MSYSTFNYKANNYIEFICDKDEDIEKLPRDSQPGSTAFVVDGAKVYMLNNQKEWVALL